MNLVSQVNVSTPWCLNASGLVPCQQLKGKVVMNLESQLDVFTPLCLSVSGLVPYQQLKGKVVRVAKRFSVSHIRTLYRSMV